MPRTRKESGRRDSQSGLAAPLSLLPLLTSGSLSVSVNEHPMLQVDSESRSLGIEVAGMRESGLVLGKLLAGGREEKSLGRLLAASEGIAKKLSEIGWTLTLYDGGSSLLSMGRGVSRLTGHVRANPLELTKLLRALR